MSAILRDFHIRPATPADYDVAAELMRADFALHWQAHPEIFKAPPQTNYDRQKFEALAMGPDSALFVAARQDEVVGLACVMVRDVVESAVGLPRRYAEIDYISVRETVRRAGVGRALVQACAGWADAQGAGHVALNVFCFNAPAIAFYESLGFAPLHRRMSLALRDREVAHGD